MSGMTSTPTVAPGNSTLAIGTPVASDFLVPQNIRAIRSSRGKPSRPPRAHVNQNMNASRPSASGTNSARSLSWSCSHTPETRSSEKAP